MEYEIIVGGKEEREKTISSLNEVIKLQEAMDAAKEHIKEQINGAYETYKTLVAEPMKKGAFSKQFKLIIAEHLAAKASETLETADSAKASYEVIKGSLI